MNPRLVFFLIAAVGAALDLATKSLVFDALAFDPYPSVSRPYDRTIEIIPGWVQWRGSMNPGIVWGLAQNWGRVFTLLSFVALPVIVVLFWRARSAGWLHTVALGLILAGAIGNFHDRVRYGAVRDFISVYIIDYPIFNVADSMICVGVGCLAIHLFREGRQAPRAGGPPSAQPAAPRAPEDQPS